MTRAPAPNSLLRRGEARLAAGDLAGARALLDHAVARDPHNAEGFAARGEVLRQQKACGGSVVLLSATLPATLRAKLLEAWDSHGPDTAHTSVPYPALWHTTGGKVLPMTVAEAQRPLRREVGIECLRLAGAFPDEDLLRRILVAAETPTVRRAAGRAAGRTGRRGRQSGGRRPAPRAAAASAHGNRR